MNFNWFCFLCPLFYHFALSAQLCSGSPQPNSTCAGWQALQQLRALIPERIWEQDFDILIDEKAFQKALPDWLPRKSEDPVYTLGHSTMFFLQSTFSGEQVRIVDRYEEFQWSPYWRYPSQLEKLDQLEKQVLKENQNP